VTDLIGGATGLEYGGDYGAVEAGKSGAGLSVGVARREPERAGVGQPRAVSACGAHGPPWTLDGAGDIISICKHFTSGRSPTMWSLR
jgi:hypothetical protein